MDTSLIATIVVAVVAIVPGTLALINQAKKDRTDAQINMSSAAQNAALNIIQPLQNEVARLQTRILELESSLIDKTTKIGQLMQEAIDKDTEIRTLKYKMEGLQMKLNSLAPEPVTRKRKSSISTELDEEIKIADEKKARVAEETERAIQELKRTSISNGTRKEGE